MKDDKPSRITRLEKEIEELKEKTKIILVFKLTLTFYGHVSSQFQRFFTDIKVVKERANAHFKEMTDGGKLIWEYADGWIGHDMMNMYSYRIFEYKIERGIIWLFMETSQFGIIWLRRR